jgi:cyanophycin synthetase
VHPDVAARAVEAAQMIGLDIAGVDVVCETVRAAARGAGRRHRRGQRRARPAHAPAPSFGKGRAVGEAIVADLFPDGDDGRIPVVAVTGTNGKTTTVRLIAHLLARACGRHDQHRRRLCDGRRIDSGDCSGPKSARNVLMHPDVDAAVFETARGGLLREGLGFDRCKVAVVTNIGEGDHLGLNYITTVEDLAVLKRVIVQNVAPDGMAVLNAADPIVARWRELPGSVTFFAADRHHPDGHAHRAQGKRVVYIDGDASSCAELGGGAADPAREVPLTRNGTIGFQVENAMAAVAAAWALGSTGRRRARRLRASPATPRRARPLQRAWTTAAPRSSPTTATTRTPSRAGGGRRCRPQRRSVVISGAGDRRDEDIREQTASWRTPSTTPSCTRTSASAAAPTAR